MVSGSGTDTQSSFDIWGFDMWYYQYYYTTSSDSTTTNFTSFDNRSGNLEPKFRKGDFVKLRSMHWLEKEFKLTAEYREKLREKQNVIFKVVDVWNMSVELDKQIFDRLEHSQYDNDGHVINKRALRKVSKKEIFESRVKLPENIFEI